MTTSTESDHTAEWPPCDLEAERKLLAAVLADPRRLDRLTLDPAELVADWRNQRVFRAMRELHRRGVNVDYGSVSEEMGRQDWPHRLRGSRERAALDFLASDAITPDGTPIEVAAARIREASRLRRIIDACWTLAERAKRAWRLDRPLPDDEAAAVLLRALKGGT